MARRASVVLAAALILALAAAPRADAYIYWGDFSGHAIGRANLNGTGAKRMFFALPGGGVAVDRGHLYWTAAFQRQPVISRARLDGSGRNRRFVGAWRFPYGVAVDSGHVYWTDVGRVGRANLDGTGVDQGFVTQARTGGDGLAVDGAHIYWTWGGGIGRANLDGTAVDHSFIPHGAGSDGLAVDGTHVYWTETDGIGRANIDGTGVEPGFIPGLRYPSGLAVDRNHVYWTEGGQYSNWGGPNIGRANLDGTRVDRSFIVVPGARLKGLAVDSLRVPRIRRLTVSPSRFAGATRVSYTLSQAATVTFRFRFRGSGRQLSTRLKRKSRRGRNHFTLTRRLRGRRLRPGDYYLVATARDVGGSVSKPKRAKFTVVGRS